MLWPIQPLAPHPHDPTRAPDGLCPPQVVVEQRQPSQVNVAELHPLEAVSVASAVPQRQREFAAGRLAARHALARLQIPTAYLLAAPDRRPCWPAHTTGSISHTRDCCLAAVATIGAIRSLGVDVEPAQPLPAELWPMIMTPQEQQLLTRQHPQTCGVYARVLFSLKEAIYKCYTNAGGGWLDFHDGEVLWHSPMPTLRLHVAEAHPFSEPHVSLICRYTQSSAYIFTACTLVQHPA